VLCVLCVCVCVRCVLCVVVGAYAGGVLNGSNRQPPAADSLSRCQVGCSRQGGRVCGVAAWSTRTLYCGVKAMCVRDRLHMYQVVY